MSAFSGETTTTNGLDGRLLSFPVRVTSTAICRNLVDNRDKRFAVSYARSASTQTCLAGLKMKQGLELLVAHFFIFPLSRLSKTEEGKLSSSLRLNSFDTPIIHADLSTSCSQCGLIKNDCGIRVNKCARRNGLKWQSANKATQRNRWHKTGHFATVFFFVCFFCFVFFLRVLESRY